MAVEQRVFVPPQRQSFELPSGMALRTETEETVFGQVYAETDIPYVALARLQTNIARLDSRAEAIIQQTRFGGEVGNVWDRHGIEGMMLKGVNPAAAEYVGATVGQVVDSIGSTDGRVVGVEFGCGAGYSTLVLYQRLVEKIGSENVTVCTIDNSPYAVAATTMLLELFNIPYRVVSGEIPDGLRDFNGIVIQLDDFEVGIRQHDQDTLAFAYSNHGTAYLPPDQHAGLLDELVRRLKPGASFITDSLDPSMRMELSKPGLIGRFITGGNRARQSVYRLKDREGYRAVTWLGGEAERRFMDLMHLLLRRMLRQRSFVGYMRALSASERTQRELFQQVKTPSGSFSQGGYTAGLQIVAQSKPKILPPFVQTARLVKPTNQVV